MERIKTVQDRIRTDCISEIILRNLRERLESLSPGYPCRVLFKDRDGWPHTVIWDNRVRNFTEIQVHHEESITFNYISYDK